MHDQFPVSIDLGITPKDTFGGPTDAKGKAKKPVYPSLYITGAESLESLPREGYALIHFKRRSITMGERDDESCCSADLEVHEIRLAEKGSEDDTADLTDAMKSMAKERGLIDGSEEEESSEDEESESESLAPDSEDEDEED